MALENPSFETEGPRAGAAPGWHVRSKASSRLKAGFRASDAVSGGGTPFDAPNDLTDASWTAVNGDVFADVATAPDGTSTADRWRNSALANVVNRVEETDLRSLEADKTYTFGAFLKREGVNAAALRFDDGSNAFTVKVGIGPTEAAMTLEFISPAAGKVDSLAAEMVVLADGWCLFSLSFKTNDAFNTKLAIAGTGGVTVGTETFTGGLNGFLVWGAFVYEGDLSDFESWDLADFIYTLDDVSTVATFGAGLDEFDGLEIWTVPYLRAIPGGVAATFNEGQPFPIVGVTTEALEAAWSNNHNYLLAIGPTGTPATFGGAVDEFDDLETGWDNTLYATAIGGAGVDASFGRFAADFEDFEAVLDDVQVTPNVDNRLYATAHGVPDDSTVKLYVRGGGEFPVPLMPTITYFTRDYNANYFSLALTSGGAAIDITSVAGVVELWVRGSPNEWWYAPDICRTI